MTIAFDNSALASSSAWLSGTPTTFSLTVGSGSDRFLVVYTLNTTNTTSVSSVTYNGVPMTKILDDSATYRSTVWILANPDSGTHNVVVNYSSGSTGNVFCSAASYSGVSGYDKSSLTLNGVLTSGNTITMSTSSSNWIVGCTTYASAVGDDTYTNATKRGSMNSAQGGRVWDSNGVTPFGNYTVTASGISQNRLMIGVSLTPVGIKTSATNNKDAMIYSSLPTSNFGGTNELYIRETSANLKGRSVINFTLPSGVGNITKVSLFLNQMAEYGSNTANITVHECTRADWVEAEVTWNIYKTSNNWTTAGGDFSATAIDTVANPHLNNWAEFVLMGIGSDNPLTLDWGDTVNLLLKTAETGGSTEKGGGFASKEHATTSIRPYIQITYTEGGTSNMLLMFI